MESVDIDDVVPPALGLLRVRGGADDAEADLRRAQLVTLACVVAHAEHQRPGIGAVVGDEVGAEMVGGRVHHLPQSDRHVLLVEAVGTQPGQIVVQVAGQARQAGIVHIVHQIRRHPTEQEPVGVALVLLHTAEHVVVDTQVQGACRAQRIAPAAPGILCHCVRRRCEQHDPPGTGPCGAAQALPRRRRCTSGRRRHLRSPRSQRTAGWPASGAPA